MDELKQSLIDTLDHISHGIIDEASDKHDCMHVQRQRQRDVTSNT